MTHKNAITAEAEVYLSAEDVNDIRDALELAQDLESSERSCNQRENCTQYTQAVTHLLLSCQPDTHTIIACILQCVNEPEGLAQIEERFGKAVAGTVATLSVLEPGKTASAHHPIEQLRRMIRGLSKNIRALLIALHNRAYLLNSIDDLDEKERQILGREALEVFAPLSSRLGMYAMKYEFETKAFPVLFPTDAKRIQESMTAIREEYGHHVHAEHDLIVTLLEEQHIPCEISSREKHAYSIFRKMQQKNLTSPTDLYDLFGMRIIVESDEDCYRTLGLIHRTYQPIAHRMKDYIAMPKPNGYRSLHTTVIGVDKAYRSLPVEIQIRTQDMDRDAEFGIAAHWNYKERGSDEPISGAKWKERLSSIGAQQETDIDTDDDDDDEGVRDRIFALTPKGDVIELPKEAGPLDFAFRVHTQVGLRYRHAKVNGAIVGIDHELENGDMVSITTWSEPRPSQQWVHMVHTKDARQKLRQHFRETGEIRHPVAESSTQPARKPVMRRAKHSQNKVQMGMIQLATDTALPFSYAKCCKPEADSENKPPIVGLITREGIVRIHKKSCRMIRNSNKERQIDADWDTSREVSQAPSQPSSAP